jgi:S-adenosylmethionine:tRNA ribosyltransferase-isomerase
MTTMLHTDRLDFVLDAEHEAHEPPEVRGTGRDDVRVLVSLGDEEPVEAPFRALPSHLQPGDVVVVNTSATIPAALDGRLPDGEPVVVHLSTELPGGLWLIEVREPSAGATVPRFLEHATTVELLAGGRLHLHRPFETSRRLWLATVEISEPVLAFAAAHGRPIRYRHVPRDWPLPVYQTSFSRTPGSAEMPGASRPITPALVTELVTGGVQLAPVLLHTGVSSLEGDEAPYPERYAVPRATADLINAASRDGRRVIAAGTTVVRAVATVTDDRRIVHPGHGWTDLVVTPDRAVSPLDGLLTGWHEPESSHLMMLEAFAGRDSLERAYREALARGFLWHEFGDSHLIIARSRPT